VFDECDKYYGKLFYKRSFFCLVIFFFEGGIVVVMGFSLFVVGFVCMFVFCYAIQGKKIPG